MTSLKETEQAVLNALADALLQTNLDTSLAYFLPVKPRGKLTIPLPEHAVCHPCFVQWAKTTSYEGVAIKYEAVLTSIGCRDALSIYVGAVDDATPDQCRKALADGLRELARDRRQRVMSQRDARNFELWAMATHGHAEVAGEYDSPRLTAAKHTPIL